MLPDAALFSMKVMFATPCYISAVSMNYTVGIFDLVMHTKRFGPECILHMHSESLITRGRNKMVLRFLEDELLTHLFWIDSDIGFTPQQVCRLLLADRDVVAGVYPMKSMHWPKEGLPEGTTREQFEVRYGEYPFNEMGKMSQYADADGFAEVAEAPTGFQQEVDIPLRDLFATWRKKSQLWPLAWHKRGEICLMSQRQPRMNTTWRLGIADALAIGGELR